MLTYNLKLSEQLENKLTAKLKKDKVTDTEYLSRLIEYDLNSRIELGGGFYYHKPLDKLYNKENKEITITRIERRILLALIEFKGDIVSADILMAKVWKRDDVSIFTFRNMILKIRDKTYYGLIVNRSKHGYSITIEDMMTDQYLIS